VDVLAIVETQRQVSIVDDDLEPIIKLRQAMTGVTPIDLPPPEVAKSIRKRSGIGRNGAALVLGVQPLQIERWEAGLQAPHPRNARKWGQFLHLLLKLEGEAGVEAAS
jgi:hypothetical protein